MIVCVGENRVAIGDSRLDGRFSDSEAIDGILGKRVEAGWRG